MKEKEDCRRMSVETGSELEVIIAALYRRSLISVSEGENRAKKFHSTTKTLL